MAHRPATPPHPPPHQAMEMARLEEEFQMEQWGLVEGGHDLDRAATKVSLTSPAVFLALLDDEEGHAGRWGRLKEAVEK